jgi:4-diphosphocytidyl-2-C-methyl-D-erythritol kinase
LIVFPNCKINLGLHIISKRTDGFHNLETVFYPLKIYDALESIIRQADRDTDERAVTLQASGIVATSNPTDNICLKAYHLLKADFPVLPASIDLFLHKAIPIGAGLGGGSADAAFTLQLLNNQFELAISDRQLQDYASRLGSDCPFFIINRPCLASGRGEILKEITLDLSNYRIVIVNPGIHINTALAFKSITPRLPDIAIGEIIRQPVETWKDNLTNDFEIPVFNNHPEIKKIKEDLYTAGALYASMSGSGSSVYGLFHSGTAVSAKFPENYFYKELFG